MFYVVVTLPYYRGDVACAVLKVTVNAYSAIVDALITSLSTLFAGVTDEWMHYLLHRGALHFPRQKRAGELSPQRSRIDTLLARWIFTEELKTAVG